MTTIFIYAHPADRRDAYTLAGRFKEAEPGLRIEVVSGHLARMFRKKVAKQDIIILLWSKRSTKNPKKWLPLEIQQNLDNYNVFSAIVDGTAPPLEFGITQQSSPLKEGIIHELQFSKLAYAIMNTLGNAERARIHAFEAGSLEDKTKQRKIERRIYSYRDLEALCESTIEKVQVYNPHILFAFDARGGIWAQYIAEKLESLTGCITPVIIGFRLRNKGPRKQSVCFEECRRIETKRWHLFVPPALHMLPESRPNWSSCRILYVDDYASSGDTCVAFRDYMVQQLKASQENVRTLTLISTEEAEKGNKAPDIFGHTTDAERADLFYMFIARSWITLTNQLL